MNKLYNDLIINLIPIEVKLLYTKYYNKGLTYKELNDYKKRCTESSSILAKYPDRIPIIVDYLKLGKNYTYKKLLVPKNMYPSQLLYIIRSKFTINPSEAIFIYYDNLSLVNNNYNIGELYDKYRCKNNITTEDDKFFYLTLIKESTFG